MLSLFFLFILPSLYPFFFFSYWIAQSLFDSFSQYIYIHTHTNLPKDIIVFYNKSLFIWTLFTYIFIIFCSSFIPTSLILYIIGSFCLKIPFRDFLLVLVCWLWHFSVFVVLETILFCLHSWNVFTGFRILGWYLFEDTTLLSSDLNYYCWKMIWQSVDRKSSVEQKQYLKIR